MHILVPIKQVIDPYVAIQFDRTNQCIKTDHMKMTMNPFDEVALEEALQIKEQQSPMSVQVTVLTIGSKACQASLKHALALGADDAIHILTDTNWQPLSIASILSRVVIDEAVDFVLMGKQAIDGDHNQTGQMLAGLLDWPQITFASKLTYDQGTLTATREIDSGLETIFCHLPAVVTVDLCLNTPRYPTLPNMMKAKSKPLVSKALHEMDLRLKDDAWISSVDAPPIKSPGIQVKTVRELIDYLRYKEQVI